MFYIIEQYLNIHLNGKINSHLCFCTQSLKMYHFSWSKWKKNTYAYMCVYVYICTYIYIHPFHTCIYTYTYTHIYIHTTYNIYTWLHTHIENNDFSKILVCIIFAITITKTSLWIFSLCLCSNTNNKVKKSLDKHSKELCSRYLHHIFTCLSLDKWFNSLISLAHLKTWDINSCPSDLTIIISIK